MPPWAAATRCSCSPLRPEQNRLQWTSMPKIDTMLSRIQNDLFDLGSDFATPGADGAEDKALRIGADQASWLEQMIDLYNEGLEPLTSFVLPGGTALASALHVARTVVRRAERAAVALHASEPDTNQHALIYLNRLSDLLFVLGRVANGNGRNDVLWEPGRYRKS